ncbi:MAG: hypothetical protein JJE30_12880 [Desulfuromonadales bacterium]|nr:hypothetical protein [Desulfuromonadales bacterium]
MLTIKVNGNEEKLNIGCRTFVSLEELLKILAVKDSTVVLNGETVRSQNFIQTTVNTGADITLTSL